MKIPEYQNNMESINNMIETLQAFIELTFHSDDIIADEWFKKIAGDVDLRCWEIKNNDKTNSKLKCSKTSCPAYKNENNRCWIIAGTMCNGDIKAQGAQNSSCSKCKVLNEVTKNDPVRKLKELIIVLIHSLQQKQARLQKALSDIKVLSGLLPICSHCKKIKDDKGDWKEIESYIQENSEAEFTHGICPECTQEFFPKFFNRVAKKK